MTQKPRGTAPAARKAGSDAGQLGVDDRGNVTWEWRDDGELLADGLLGRTARIRALADPSLQVTDDDDPQNPVGSTRQGLKTGYYPYRSGALDKQSWKKRKDLRELSRWIELRKKMAEKKPGEE